MPLRPSHGKNPPDAHDSKQCSDGEKTNTLTCSSSGGTWDSFENKSGACFRKGWEPLL